MGQSQSGQLTIANGTGVYIETSKDTFTVGQFVEGAVYVKAQKLIQISSIWIHFWCKESVNIIKHFNEESTTFKIDGSPYEDQFEIESFKKSEHFQRNLIFPFKFLLPSELPGSILINPQNFLRYIISAQVHVSGTKQAIRSNEAIIHLTEPFRSQFQRIDESITNYPQCCDCCESYGTVYTKLSCDTNLIKPGEKIKIEGQIDNTHGRVPVRNARVSLKMYVFQGSPQGQNEYFTKNSFQIERFGPIQNGTKKNISVTKKIPTSFSQQSTAFGTIIAAYYTLAIESEMGLFSRGANISVPVQYITETPYVQKNLKLKVTSTFSSPKTFPVFTQTNMKNYIYKPVEGMPNTNRKSLNPQGNLSMMGRSYMASEIDQANIYEIKKTKTVNNEKMKGKMQKEPADPDVAGSSQVIQDRQNAAQNYRQRKYMDEQNQNDYDKFRDFQQNQPNLWSNLVGNFLHQQIRF